MDFRLSEYSADIARILQIDGDGIRPMPLVSSGCVSPLARAEIKKLQGRAPEGVMAGLYLYFSCNEDAHKTAQDLNTAEGSFWHGILHRQEPDATNAGYWFRQVGKHAVFPALREEARRLNYDAGTEWDPMAFIRFCEGARKKPESAEEQLAMQVQLVEWQLLFQYCARDKAR